jgi:ATP-dependent DNA helicase RecQ
VVPHLNYGQRIAWVDEFLQTAEGSGIIYGLTVAVVEQLAAFLRERGHDVEPYTGQTPPDVREEIEARLRANSLKAVIGHIGLGHGLRQAGPGVLHPRGFAGLAGVVLPAGGPGGRALDSAVGVLLPAGESDQEVWDWFATATLPDPEMAERLLQLLRQEPMKTAELVEALARSKGKVEVLLKQLRVDGVVDLSGGRWVATGRPWRFDADKYDRIVDMRRREAGIMSSYALGQRCLMQLLTESLDDPASAPCGRCSVCTGELPHPGRAPDRAIVEMVYQSLRRRPVRITPRKLWPSSSGRKGKIAGIGIGRAITGIDGGVYPELVEEAFGPDASLSPELREAFAELLARWRREDMPIVTAVVPVPSAGHPVRVRELAELAAAQLGLPVVEVFAQPVAVEEPVQGSGGWVKSPSGSSCSGCQGWPGRCCWSTTSRAASGR